MIHRANHVSVHATLPVMGGRRAEQSAVTTAVLTSLPISALSFVFNRKGLTIDPRLIVYKDVTDTLVRLIFPVNGGRIEDGAVVSVVCLFDRKTNQTLYAHPMHAGPNVNPLVKHLDGPMAAPKPQSGADGDRADRRIIEHKRALWDRFTLERTSIGETEAERHWRDGYYWSLQRLYFCCGCHQCKWGSPVFDGPDPLSPRKAIVSTPTPTRLSDSLSEEHRRIVPGILASEAWRVETAYARRGGFTVLDQPRLLKHLDGEFVQVIFPTNVSLIVPGVLTAASFTYHIPSKQVALAHCLCAGPDAEIQFLKGNTAFGIPTSQPGVVGANARTVYQSQRRAAWTEYWLNELECGIEVASEKWLAQFWNALEILFGGNAIHGSSNESASPVTHAAPATGGVGMAIPPQALENIGGKCFTGHATYARSDALRVLGLSTLMVNLGHRCNQACGHCHVDAGPNRTEEMDRETVDHVLRVLRGGEFEVLDITGGAPELNPHFRYLASEASRLGCRVVDRCNLTIIFEPGYEDLPEFLAAHGIEVTASLPSDDAKITDSQRGLGSFAKSISALQKLNKIGYGDPSSGLVLNLVHNPAGTEIPESQEALETRFKRELSARYGITFNRLFAMNNMPIHRFKHYLKRERKWAEYTNRLVRTFNHETLDGLMCRRGISVGYDGRLYDCDFNQVMDIPLMSGLPVHVRDLDVAALRTRLINTAGHCFGCASGAGSSCSGSLVALSSQLISGDQRIGRTTASQTGAVGQ